MERKPFKYVVVRYIPDIAKDEPVNVGVIMQDTSGWMTGRFADRLDRLERLPVGTDRKFLRQMIDAVADQVKRQLRGRVGAGPAESALERWGADLVNQVQFTAPRVTLPEDPEKELDRLYSCLVSEGRPPMRGAWEDDRVHSAVRSKLSRLFRSRKIDYRQFVLERIMVEGQDWPEIPIGFAYHNGKITLANPLSLDVKERRAEEKLKVWETNYTDILEKGNYDLDHIVTVLHLPNDVEPRLQGLALKVLRKVSTVVPDRGPELDAFAIHVLQSAEPWPPGAQRL